MSQRRRWLDYTMIVLAAVFGTGPFFLLIISGSSGLTHFRMSQINILLWDTFLSVVFFAQHSGMVRRSFRARLSPVVQARYHGIIYTIASGISLAIVVIF